MNSSTLFLSIVKNKFNVKNNLKTMAATKSHWSYGLINSYNDNTQKLEEDDQIYVLKDKYPKARYHYLVLSKKDISSISKVTKNDLKVLDHMEKIACKYVNRHQKYTFLIGYHAIPSMQRLHLHVISTDFNSPCLKKMRHWNSFTTPFFLSSRDVQDQVEKHGEMKIDTKSFEEYLEKQLQCHKCSYYPKNMLDLKNHIIKHIS